MVNSLALCKNPTVSSTDPTKTATAFDTVSFSTNEMLSQSLAALGELRCVHMFGSAIMPKLHMFLEREGTHSVEQHGSNVVVVSGLTYSRPRSQRPTRLYPCQ